MIVYTPDQGRSKLDRDIPNLIRTNEETRKTLTEVAPGYPLTDKVEAWGELLREDPVLARLFAKRTALIHARNKKHIHEETPDAPMPPLPTGHPETPLSDLPGLLGEPVPKRGDLAPARDDVTALEGPRPLNPRCRKDDPHHALPLGEGLSVSKPVLAPPPLTRPEPGPVPSASVLDLWQRLSPALRERVFDQNFEIWLSGVRLGGIYAKCIELEAPNGMLKEYLAEHYTAVIQEELAKIGERRPVVFTCTRHPEREGNPPPKKEEPPTPPKRTGVTDPQLLALAARIAEQRALDPQGRSIVVTNKLSDLIDQYKVREEAILSLAKQRPRRDSS